MELSLISRCLPGPHVLPHTVMSSLSCDGITLKSVPGGAHPSSQPKGAGLIQMCQPVPLAETHGEGGGKGETTQSVGTHPPP